MTTPPRIAYGHEIFVGSMFGRRAFGSRPPRETRRRGHVGRGRAFDARESKGFTGSARCGGRGLGLV